MDNNIHKNLNDKKYDYNNSRSMSAIQKDVKSEDTDSFTSKKSVKKPIYASEMFDEKDLLIAQLQEQIAKQRECISYYENIVQLMNYRLMKLKKVLKAHHLLEELD